jgi:antitoxin PrlF
MVVMKRLVSTLSQKGQTTIPQTVRETLGVNEGDVIQYEVDGDIVRLRKLERIDTQWTRALETTLSEWKGSDDDDL